MAPKNQAVLSAQFEHLNVFIHTEENFCTQNKYREL